MSSREKIAASLRLLAQSFEAGEVVAFNVSWLNGDLEPTTLCWPGEDHVHRMCLGEAITLSHDMLVRSWGDPVPRKHELFAVRHGDEEDDET